MQEQGDSMNKSHFSVNPKMKDWSKAERDAYILQGKEPNSQTAAGSTKEPFDYTLTTNRTRI